MTCIADLQLNFHVASKRDCFREIHSLARVHLVLSRVVLPPVKGSQLKLAIAAYML